MYNTNTSFSLIERVLYFYGLGLGLSTNTYNENQYKFELMLLAKYEEDFSTYTLRCFLEEYIAMQSSITSKEKLQSIKKLQSGFTITSVKVFLVSLLNGKWYKSCYLHKYNNHLTLSSILIQVSET